MLTAIVADRRVLAVAADYFLEIESHFAQRRRTPFILNSKDWLLMKKWQEEGVPLPVVIEAIDSVFDKNEAKGSKKVINSLTYCQHAVRELWAERRELHVGSGEATPEEGVETLLEELAAALEASAAPAGVTGEFAIAIRGLGSEKSVPRIEERLIDLEHELIARVVEASGDGAGVQSAVASMIGDRTRLDEKTRARTEEANLRRVVRERFSLPRLTLFR